MSSFAYHSHRHIGIKFILSNMMHNTCVNLIALFLLAAVHSNAQNNLSLGNEPSRGICVKATQELPDYELVFVQAVDA